MNRFKVNVRFFRSREALLVLIWTAFPLSVLASPFFIGIATKPYVLLASLCLPFAGCLSDMCIKRYTTIRYSMWLIWVIVMFYNVQSLLNDYCGVSLAWKKYETVVSVVTLIGIAVVWINAFQLGIDQLIDASSSDITSYISWYVWTLSLALAAVPYFQKCSCGDYNSATTYYFIPLLGTLALVTDFLFSKSLVKEPPTHNPFKLIYQVLKYAVKNKYPKQRSAFTYWEDKPYSRIDLGKAKYGGPFTTEQVEDVKTFFRLLIVIIASSPYMGVTNILNLLFYDLLELDVEYTLGCSDNSVANFLSHCFQHGAIKYSAVISVLVFVPLLELILYPIAMMLHCTKKTSIKQKLLFGTVLLLLYEMYLAGLEIARVSLGSHKPRNATCIFGEHQIEKHIDKWIVLPQPILGIALYILSSSYLEFLCAQSPYSMKGVLVGFFYSVNMVSVAAAEKLLYLLKDRMDMLGSNCLMWLYVAILSLTATLICIQFISLKCYKLRRRDDVLRNDQMFAVNYFNKYLSPTPHPVHRHHQ